METNGEQPAREVLPDYRSGKQTAFRGLGRWQQMVQAVGAIFDRDPEASDA